MPSRLILFTVHNYLTKRDYSYSLDDICDFGITVCVSVWLYTWFDWSIIDCPPDATVCNVDWDKYTFWLFDKAGNDEFNFIIFLAVLIVLFWVRFLLMLQLTRSFGPMLRIIVNMFGDVLKFLFIWSIVMLCLASVASLLFGELPQYAKFLDAFLLTFGTGLASYNLTYFETLELGSVVGEIFTVCCLLINTVVFLNFIIAILADTYSKLSKSSLGLYYDGIISRIPVYEDDRRYGGLIVGIPPFSILALLMIPFYMSVTNEKVLRKVNDWFTKIMFAPMALLITLVFMLGNIILLPFAYVVAIVKKVKQLRS